MTFRRMIDNSISIRTGIQQATVQAPGPMGPAGPMGPKGDTGISGMDAVFPQQLAIDLRQLVERIDQALNHSEPAMLLALKNSVAEINERMNNTD